MCEDEKYCSFCGDSSDEVLVLIEGTNCYICDKCVELCREVVREKKKEIQLAAKKETREKVLLKSIRGKLTKEEKTFLNEKRKVEV